MRRLLALPVLLLVAAPALGQGGTGPVATLTLDVQDDHAETGTLTFAGLKRLTRYESICLPERATETRVYDELGDLTYDGRTENGRRTLSFMARGETVTIDLERDAPPATDHPLYASDVNFCVPADSSVAITVRVRSMRTSLCLARKLSVRRPFSSRASYWMSPTPS